MYIHYICTEFRYVNIDYFFLVDVGWLAGYPNLGSLNKMPSTGAEWPASDLEKCEYNS